jgi:hypothetical protein
MSRFLPLLTLLAVPALAASSWPISKPDAEYPQTAQTNGVVFAFIEPADTMHPPQGDDSNMVVTNGVQLQTFYVPAVGGSAEQSLAAHRKAETALLQQSGAVVSESHFCSRVAQPHGEWRSTLKGIRDSRYLTVKSGDAIKVTIVASNPKSPRGGAEQRMQEICKTLGQ